MAFVVRMSGGALVLTCTACTNYGVPDIITNIDAGTTLPGMLQETKDHVRCSTHEKALLREKLDERKK